MSHTNLVGVWQHSISPTQKMWVLQLLHIQILEAPTLSIKRDTRQRHKAQDSENKKKNNCLNNDPFSNPQGAYDNSFCKLGPNFISHTCVQVSTNLANPFTFLPVTGKGINVTSGASSFLIDKVKNEISASVCVR